MRTPPALIVAVAAGLVACGTEDAGRSAAGPPSEAPDHVVPDDYTGPFRVSNITVLSSPEHGPQLCTEVLASYPPGCEGPNIVEWDWDVVEHESAHGTSWGSYQLVGTWDDGVFTLTEPATAPKPVPEDDDPLLDSACSEPPGGWEIPDRSRATPVYLERASLRTPNLEGYAGGWVSWLIPEARRFGPATADPDNYVLNVLTTGDLDATETAVREIWGGQLCVAAPSYPTREERDQIAMEIMDTPGVLAANAASAGGTTVRVDAWVAYEGLWEQLAGEYGSDVIDLQSILQPIEEPHHK